MKLTFHGGARRVTGANYLLESEGEKILIDCGLMQGSDYAERRNFEPFPYDPKSIGAVFITHAHIDHTGRLPKLVKDGFRGTVFSTLPTMEFAEHLLEDSVDILTREAKKHEREAFCDKDTLKILKELWKGMEYYKAFEHGPFKITFHNAGHILGSSFIEIEAEGKTIVFSGDLGNSPAPLIPKRENLKKADYCLIESTYGARVHERLDQIQDDLEDIIEDTAKAGGTLMIPAFAMERTQTLLFHINQLIEEGRVPDIPIFLDSPLAIRLTNFYEKFKSELNKETKEFIEKGNKLFNFPRLKKTMKTEESKAILKVPPPKVIIAGSGMSQGGRIIHHEKNYLPDPNSAILFVGYQVEGSLGRRILDGKKEGKPFSVKILRKQVPVKAQAKAIGGYSAHADQPQLLEWLQEARFSLKKVFVVQGEEDQSRPFAQKVRDELAVEAVVPSEGEEVVL